MRGWRPYEWCVPSLVSLHMVFGYYLNPLRRNWGSISGHIKWDEYILLAGIAVRVLAKIVPKRAKYGKKLLPVKDLAIIIASSVNELTATTAFARI